MFARVLLIAVPAAVLGLGLGLGCEKVDHDNIEKWSRTSKGPMKLRKALADESLDADLSAHAAATMIKRGDDLDAYAVFEAMVPQRRSEVIAKLAPRLWSTARIEADKDLPNAVQIVAKDALVRVRKWADDDARTQIDGYLIDWYCVPSYEGRAQVGANLGATVMRLIGPTAAKRLMSVVNGVIAAPGQDKVKNRIGDELLLGLAATASPDAVKYVLDIARMDRGDPTLGRRAMSALYKAYVDPYGLFDVADAQALIPNTADIVEIAKNDALEPQAANDAVALIRALGTPRCLQPLLGMVAAPHKNSRFKYVAANNALKCGGTKAIVDVVRALPDAGAYAKDQVNGAISGEIAKMTPHDQAQAAARALLGERSTLAKWVGMEALAAMKSTDDAPRIAALATNRQRLIGYWGERGEGKEDPTLGQVARELSAALGSK
jgi:hypothetical protein